MQGELGHPNLLRLLGVIDSPDGIPSSVSEFCTATLAEVRNNKSLSLDCMTEDKTQYLTDSEHKPRRLELVGTKRSTAYYIIFDFGVS